MTGWFGFCDHSNVKTFIQSPWIGNVPASSEARQIVGSRRRGGFTLLELVMVLVLLGVLVAWVSITGVETHAGVVSGADTLRAHLRYAQTLAVANNTADWSVQFNARSYTLRRDDLDSPIPWPGEDSPTYVLPDGVNVVQGGGVLALDTLGAPPATYIIGLSDGVQQEQVVVTGRTGLIP